MFTHVQRRTLALAAALALSGAGQTAAQAQQQDPLGALVAEALKNNLGLETERLTERRVATNVTAARALFLPSLGLSARYSQVDGVPNIGDLINPAYATLNQVTGTNRFPTNINFTLPQRYESRLELVQPLFNVGVIANYKAATARDDAQHFQTTGAARQLAADVQTAYLQEASARRAVEIFAATLDVVKESERVSQRLLDAGSATPEAVYRARAERAQVEQRLAEAQQLEHAAASNLNRIVRRPLDSPVAVIPDSVFAELPLDISADSAVAHALATREELRQIDAGVRGAEALGLAATSAFLPNVSLALDYGFQGHDVTFAESNHNWLASVVVSWNLFNGGRDAAHRAEADYEADRARTQKQDVSDQITVQVRNAHEAATVARAAIATADTRLEAARRTFELVRHRYDEGVATPVEFVDARTEFTSAQLNRVLTAYRYAIRWVELERAAALRHIAY